MRIFFLLLISVVSLNLYSQDAGFGSAANAQKSECLSASERNNILRILNEKRKVYSETIESRVSKKEVSFIFPIRRKRNYDEPGYYGISNYVDLNDNYPGEHLDYNCGNRTYDTESGYNHAGTDYFSWPYAWSKMDQGEVIVVAAAAGIIIYKQASNQDKSCSFNSSNWNAVYLEHGDGTITWYGHLKKNSLTDKVEGDYVEAGEFLGVMGSSGNSTGPHLHLEVYNSDGQLIDPYQGDCNGTTNRSWWENQAEYYSPGINNVLTHSTPPVFGCYDEEVFNNDVNFQPGQTVYFATYFRDQLIGTSSDHKILKPDGSVFQSWTTSPTTYYSGSYWWRSFSLPNNQDDIGEWQFVVTYNGMEVSHAFYMTNETQADYSIEMDGACDISEGPLADSFTIFNDSESVGLVVDSIGISDDLEANWNGIVDAGSSKTIFIENPENISGSVITIYTASGDRTFTIGNISQEQEVAICDGEVFEFGDQILEESGSYTETFQTSFGCDSLVTLNLTVNPAYNLTQDITLAFGETYEFGSQLIDEGGVFTEVFKSQTGCDSTVVLTVNGGVLSSSRNLFEDNVKFYPNPTNDLLQMDFGEIITGKLEVTNLSGQLLKEVVIKTVKRMNLDLANLPKAPYIVSIEGSDKIAYIKVLVKN
jgi:hypothetical protein